jgi:hypothetical protein
VGEESEKDSVMVNPDKTTVPERLEYTFFLEQGEITQGDIRAKIPRGEFLSPVRLNAGVWTLP